MDLPKAKFIGTKMKFNIEVTRTETKTHNYTIEAESLNEAELMAYERAANKDWNNLIGGDVEYDVSAVSGDKVQVYMEGLPQGVPIDPSVVETFIAGLVKRYESQGYYFSCKQERIPVSEIRDRLITVGTPVFEGGDELEEIDDDDEVEEIPDEDFERAFGPEALKQRKEQRNG